MASRQEGCTQNLQHCVGHHEVQGFDCARISFALFSAANLASLRANIRGFSALTPPSADRSPRCHLALILHVPHMYLPGTWLLPPNRLPITWLAPGLDVSLADFAPISDHPDTTTGTPDSSGSLSPTLPPAG